MTVLDMHKCLEELISQGFGDEEFLLEEDTENNWYRFVKEIDLKLYAQGSSETDSRGPVFDLKDEDVPLNKKHVFVIKQGGVAE